MSDPIYGIDQLREMRNNAEGLEADYRALAMRPGISADEAERCTDTARYHESKAHEYTLMIGARLAEEAHKRVNRIKTDDATQRTLARVWAEGFRIGRAIRGTDVASDEVANPYGRRS